MMTPLLYMLYVTVVLYDTLLVYIMPCLYGTNRACCTYTAHRLHLHVASNDRYDMYCNVLYCSI